MSFAHHEWQAFEDQQPIQPPMIHIVHNNKLVQRQLIMVFIEASDQAGFIMHRPLATAFEDRIVEDDGSLAASSSADYLNRFRTRGEIADVSVNGINKRAHITI